MEGISGTSKTLGSYYKRGWSQQQKPFNNKESEQKDPSQNFFKIQKKKKRRKTL